MAHPAGNEGIRKDGNTPRPHNPSRAGNGGTSGDGGASRGWRRPTPRRATHPAAENKDAPPPETKTPRRIIAVRRGVADGDESAQR